MIKPKELTIGDTVLHKNEIKHIISIKPFGVQFESLKEESTPFDELDGVLLTEEWLNKNGFQLRRSRFGKAQEFKEDFVKTILKSTTSGFETAYTIVISRSEQNSWKITVESIETGSVIAEYSLIYFVHLLENIIAMYE